MSPAYLIAQTRTAASRVPLRTRLRSTTPRLKWSDPALRAMTDFVDEPPLILPEHSSVEEAIDQMFRRGVRAFLVVRDQYVVGLMSAAQATLYSPRQQRVSDAMTPTDEAPAIDWNTLHDARVVDLIEIFEGTGVEQLMVLESHSARLSSVRGLVYRERLQRQLTAP